MSVEDTMAFYCLLQFLVARSKEFSLLCQVVAGPLAREWDDECVSKVIFGIIFGGGAPDLTKGGRTTLRKRGGFDSTLGFPGEDGHV